MKHCTKCNTTKPHQDFSKHKNRKDGLSSECKSCASNRNKKWYGANKNYHNSKGKQYYKANEDQYRERQYKRKYGITLDDWNKMYETQNGVCALCKLPETKRDHRRKATRRLSVDHCHDTGRVRGLLCYNCNHIIARLGDNLESAEKLVKYMKGTLINE